MLDQLLTEQLQRFLSLNSHLGTDMFHKSQSINMRKEEYGTCSAIWSLLSLRAMKYKTVKQSSTHNNKIIKHINLKA